MMSITNSNTNNQPIICHKCGKSHYQELYTTSTAMYCPPVYRNGVLVSSDRNHHTVNCKCLECGSEFSYKR